MALFDSAAQIAISSAFTQAGINQAIKRGVPAEIAKLSAQYYPTKSGSFMFVGNTTQEVFWEVTAEELLNGGLVKDSVERATAALTPERWLALQRELLEVFNIGLLPMFAGLPRPRYDLTSIENPPVARFSKINVQWFNYHGTEEGIKTLLVEDMSNEHGKKTYRREVEFSVSVWVIDGKEVTPISGGWYPCDYWETDSQGVKFFEAVVGQPIANFTNN